LSAKQRALSGPRTDIRAIIGERDPGRSFAPIMHIMSDRVPRAVEDVRGIIALVPSAQSLLVGR
jgi:hypothetical protein